MFWQSVILFKKHTGDNAVYGMEEDSQGENGHSGKTPRAVHRW